MFWTYVIYRPTSAEIFEPCHRLESLSYEITMARPHGRDGFSRGCDEARLRVTTFCPFLGGSKSSQIKFSNRSMWKMMWQDWKTKFFVKKNVIVSDLLFCVYVSICLSIYLSIFIYLSIYSIYFKELLAVAVTGSALVNPPAWSSPLQRRMP